VQRFGSALNAHTHLHCCVADRVFSLDAAGTLRFHPAADLDDAALRAVQRRIRIRVLRIAVHYCARLVFASERLFWEGHDRPAALLPPPRRHRHHYFGVFAPHAALRARDPPGPALHFDQTLN
jgi:hypothetical protein